MTQDQCPALVEMPQGTVQAVPLSVLDLIGPGAPRLRLSDVRGSDVMLTPQQASAQRYAEDVEACLRNGMSADGAMMSAFVSAARRYEAQRKA